jgi:transposase InsO family protein
MNWYSRKVLSWQVLNTMDVGFCVNTLTVALDAYGTSGIFNTDQGLPAHLRGVHLQARAGLAAYFWFYNTIRKHQSLQRQPPDEVYDPLLRQRTTAA